MLLHEAFEFGHLLLAVEFLPVRGMLIDVVQFVEHADLKFFDVDRALVAGIVPPWRTRLSFFDLHLTFLAAVCWIL